MAARKNTIFLLIGFALSFSIISCNAETLQQATDVFELTNDGRKCRSLPFWIKERNMIWLNDF